MDSKRQEEVALHRWAVIAEAASAHLTSAERGAVVRQVALSEGVFCASRGGTDWVSGVIGRPWGTARPLMAGLTVLKR